MNRKKFGHLESLIIFTCVALVFIQVGIWYKNVNDTNRLSLTVYNDAVKVINEADVTSSLILKDYSFNELDKINYVKYFDNYYIVDAYFDTKEEGHVNRHYFNCKISYINGSPVLIDYKYTKHRRLKNNK